MFGAIAATGMPSCNSIWCFAKVAACAELPRAQVTANCGGRDLSRATSVTSGTLHQLDRGRIELFRVLDDEWREPAEFGWPRTVRPAHDRVGVAGEFVEQTPEQRGRCDTAVIAPQRLPQRLAAQPGSATL